MKLRFFLLIVCLVGHSNLLAMDKRAIYAEAVTISNSTTNDCQFTEAASRGDLQSCLRLLQEKTNINARDKNGNTALINAVSKGHKEIVQLILAQAFIDINARGALGTTALMTACARDDNEIVELLLRHPDIAINQQDNDGWTALITAIQFVNKKNAQSLLNQQGIAINIKDKDGQTALTHAVQIDEKTIVQLLLDKQDIDVNLQNNDGMTALMIASQVNFIDIVKMLLHKPGINLNSKDSFGKTALIRASARGHREIVELLLNQQSIAIHAQDDQGETALSVAAAGNQKDVVQLLLGKSDININIQNFKEGDTGLIVAAKLGHKEIVKLLLDQKGIAVNVQNNEGATALMLAARGGHKEIILLLIGHPIIDIICKDRSGKTAYMYAVQNGHKESAQLLNFKGVLPEEAYDDSRDSRDAVRASLISVDALISASKKGHDEIVKLFLDKTVDAEGRPAGESSPQSQIDAAQNSQVCLQAEAQNLTGPCVGFPPEMMLEVLACAGWKQDLVSLLKTIASINKVAHLWRKAMHTRSVLDKMLSLSDIRDWTECRQFLFQLLLGQPHVSVADKFRLGWLISTAEGITSKTDLFPWFERFIRCQATLPRFSEEKKQLIECLPRSLAQVVEANKSTLVEEIKKHFTIFTSFFQTKFEITTLEDQLNFLELFYFSCLSKSWRKSFLTAYRQQGIYPPTFHLPSEQRPTVLFELAADVQPDQPEETDKMVAASALSEIVRNRDVNAQNIDGDTFAHLVFRKNRHFFVNFLATLYPAVEVNLAIPNKKGERAISYLHTLPFTEKHQKALRHFARVTGIDFPREQLKIIGPILGPLISRENNHDREATIDTVLKLDEQQGKVRFRIAAWCIQSRESSFGVAHRIILGWRLALKETSEERVNGIFNEIELLKKENTQMKLEIPRLLLGSTQQLNELRLYIRSLIVEGNRMRMSDSLINNDLKVALDVLELLSLEVNDLRSLACFSFDEETKAALSRRLIEVCSAGGPETEKQVVELLIEGAEQNGFNDNGVTAILSAAIRSESSLITLLSKMNRFFPAKFSPQAFQLLAKNCSYGLLKELFRIWDLRKVKDTSGLPFIHYVFQRSDIQIGNLASTEVCTCEAIACKELRRKLQEDERKVQEDERREKSGKKERERREKERQETDRAYYAVGRGAVGPLWKH